MKRPLVLIGDSGSKGVDFFTQAAQSQHCPLRFVPMPYGSGMESFDVNEFRGCVVKLDPPRFGNSDLLKANEDIASYRELLYRFGQADDIRMLNEPSAILQTLDKRNCKEILSRTGVAITPVFADGITDMMMLRQMMKQQRKYRVFIKPTYGSGAGGILAYQMNPRNGQEVLYTSALREQNGLYNTKKLRRFDNSEEIKLFGDVVLGAGAIVEEWMPKARYCGKSYDLRVVYQFGRIEYMVARCSSGPITNLHLNNDGMDVAELKLPDKTITEIGQLCRSASRAFNGLRSAGIDILLTPETLKPYIIEINAQGDLIYQDIYRNNQIYQAQIKYLQNEMMDGGQYEK